MQTCVAGNRDDNDDDYTHMPARLGAVEASLSLLCRLVLSDLIGADNKQMVKVRQNHTCHSNDVVLSDTHPPSICFPPLSSRSEQVCLTSPGLLHTHLVLAGKRFNYYN